MPPPTAARSGVMGHNGFLRHFAGDLALARTAQLDAEIASATTSPTAMSAKFMNNGVAPCTFVVTPNAYYVNHERWTLTVPAGRAGGTGLAAGQQQRLVRLQRHAERRSGLSAPLRRPGGRQARLVRSRDGHLVRRAPRPGGRGLHGSRGVRPQRAACAARAPPRVAAAQIAAVMPWRACSRRSSMPIARAEGPRSAGSGRMRNCGLCCQFEPLISGATSRRLPGAPARSGSRSRSIPGIHSAARPGGAAGGRSAARALGAVETQEGVVRQHLARVLPARRAGDHHQLFFMQRRPAGAGHLAAGLDQEGGIQVAVLDAPASSLAPTARTSSFGCAFFRPTPTWTACPCRTRCCPPTPNRPARPARCRQAQAVTYPATAWLRGSSRPAALRMASRPLRRTARGPVRFQGAHLEADGCLGEGDLLGCFGEEP